MKTTQLLLFVTALLIISCENTQTIKPSQQVILRAEQISITDLKKALIKLQHGQTEYQFIGITSNGIDCIYFVYEDNEFNIEFEAMSKDQLPFIKKLADFADLNNLKHSLITYNNQANFQSDKPARVLRIEVHASIDEIVALGNKIQTEIFHNNQNTVYEIVP